VKDLVDRFFKRLPERAVPMLVLFCASLLALNWG
jgi:hypothetical protein